MRYLVRALSPSGLRIGLNSKSIEHTLLKVSHELVSDPDIEFSLADARDFINYFESEVFGYSIRSETKFGLPSRVMLGRAAKSADEVVQMFTTKGYKQAVVDFKYDGERTQIHYDPNEVKDKKVRMFSRNFESQDAKFSRLKQQLEEILEGKV